MAIQWFPGHMHLTKKADEFAFYTPPTLELNGEAVFGGAKAGGFHGKMTGRFAVGRFAAKSIIFEGASAEFSWDGDRWFVRDARITHRSAEHIAAGTCRHHVIADHQCTTPAAHRPHPAAQQPATDRLF